jgi:hypothetical protein
MDLRRQLEAIRDLLQAGESPRNEVCQLIEYSLEKADETPDRWNPESLHASKSRRDRDYPPIPDAANILCGELGELLRVFDTRLTKSEVYELAKDYAKTFAVLVARWERAVQLHQQH